MFAAGCGVSVANYHRWNKEYGGAKMETVKRPKELQKESARLEKLVAEQALDMLKEIAKGKWWARLAFEKLSRICSSPLG
jgi:hypothetical protein